MKLSNQSLKYYFLSLSTFCLLLFTVSPVNAQDRVRVVDQAERQQIRSSEQTLMSGNTRRRILTNKIEVTNNRETQSLVTKTSSSRSTTPVTTRIKRSYYNATASSMMYRSIQSKIGIRYILGTQGPSSYDCSGFIWKVFQEAGIDFTRTSARNFWNTFEPVSGDERFQFGTLVFFNNLGHVGIVADENGFYHASSSQGVTYSKFDGYWSQRVVGFRRIPLNYENDWEIISEDSER